jgi:quinol monooxygenase YgiN
MGSFTFSNENEQALQLHYEQDYTKAVFAQYEEWLEKPVEVTKMLASSSVTSAQF